MARALAASLIVACIACATAANASAPPRLHATRGSAPGLFDSHGRQVLLHGVAVNQLGDYYQVDPKRKTTFALKRRDFRRIHALGFDVVRLIMSWSRLEPKPGKLDEGYIRRIRRAVGWARRSGVYVILDMHQDAWGKYVATPKGATCVPGFTPSIGWDGAPRWATFLGGMSTCHKQFREVSPAVATAFDNFYDDHSGIQTHFVRAWSRLARTFAADSTVAGFDLFNEPHPGTRLGPVSQQEIGAFYARTIAAIRKAESGRRKGFHHPILFEPSVLYDVTVAPGDSPLPDFTSDRDVVFAPHIYPGTFSPASTDDEFKATSALASTYQTTYWIGEWGWYSRNARDDYANIRDFAAHADAALVGDAWWQWRQRCGDPHEFGDPSSKGSPIADGLNRYRCPGDHPLGIPPTTKRVLGRSYARFAPGRLTSLTSDPAKRAFRVRGSDASRRGSCKLVVWTPASKAGRPRFARTNVKRIRTRRAAGGWVTTGCAHGSYELRRKLPRSG